MPIRVMETQESRTLRDGYESNQKGIDLEFVAWDDTLADLSPVDVEAAVIAVIEAAPYGNPLFGLYYQTLALRPLTRSIFMCTVPYGSFDKETIRFGFTTAGGTEHVTDALSRINAYAATGFSAPNHGTSVNVNEHGVQGYQRPIAQLSFWVTGWFDPANWTATDWLNLTDLSYTTNLASWHGWPAGHVLFEHAEAPEIVLGQTQKVPVKFYFKAKRPETVAPGDGISFTKDPWDLVWPEFVAYADNTAKRRAYKLLAMHRMQEFAASDFTLLGLGS